MLIDTHCHLDAPAFDPDRIEVLTRAQALGVAAIVLPAVSRANWTAVQQLAEQHPGLYFALGIHPLYVDQAVDGDLQVLRQRVEAVRTHPRFVGVGEIGLDFFVSGLDLERQQRFFDEQLRLARDFELPVILHSRRAVDAVTRQLRRFRPPSGIAHAFNGSRQQAGHLIGLNMALGFGGAMTFERARNIRRLASELPVEALVLETDAPDIPPAWAHPGRNEPTELPRIVAMMARLRGIDTVDLVGVSGQNARRVLPGLS
ncbi:MAG: TatD family hydrolase [Lautropia sp.]|nr:TatD family hydrolase [Lautropia sp.]